ncbi:hypothetical protein ACKKBF_B31160 [Auxenochlorella protothecoides x Auxenochlorella symbiontica]
MEYLPRNEVPTLTHVLRALKRAEHGLYNCIASIVHDHEFVEDVTARYPGVPVLPNLRCGGWYVPDPTHTCAFKSTDGHSGNWSFSTTRLNLNVAQLSARHGGCILVDATRRGKRFPDAFSKTLPIWAAVVNRAVAQIRGTTVEESDWDAALHLPAWVPDSEAHQIGLRLDGWAADLLHVCPDLHGLAGTLLKPLRCMWLAPDSRTWGDAMDGSLADLAFTPLILVSASLSSGRQRRCLELGPTADGDALQLPYDYVPGAGDDEETWAGGLSPEVMWQHHRQLLEAGPAGAEARAARLMAGRPGPGGLLPRQGRRRGAGTCTDQHHPLPAGLGAGAGAQAPAAGSSRRPVVVPGTNLFLALDADQDRLALLVDLVLDLRTATGEDCGAAPGATMASPGMLALPVPPCKRAKAGLLRRLPAVLDAVCPALRGGRRVGMLGDAGGDALAGAAVAVLAALYSIDAAGGLRPREGGPGTGTPAVSKTDVQRYLGVVAAASPAARPTRGMLKQVFAYFHAEQARAAAG